MPTSIKSLEWVLLEDYVSNHNNSIVIDIGAGTGQKSDLLRRFTKQIVWVEVFHPYVEQYNTKSKYDVLIEDDIMNVYKDIVGDVWIFGDVLEHLSVENAQEIISYLKDKWVVIYVQVPYMYPQDEAFGNKYEIHLQPDITEEVFNERYPWFKLLSRDTEVWLYKFTQ